MSIFQQVFLCNAVSPAVARLPAPGLCSLRLHRRLCTSSAAAVGRYGGAVGNSSSSDDKDNVCMVHGHSVGSRLSSCPQLNARAHNLIVKHSKLVYTCGKEAQDANEVSSVGGGGSGDGGSGRGAGPAVLRHLPFPHHVPVIYCAQIITSVIKQNKTCLTPQLCRIL